MMSKFPSHFDLSILGTQVVAAGIPSISGEAVELLYQELPARRTREQIVAAIRRLVFDEHKLWIFTVGDGYTVELSSDCLHLPANARFQTLGEFVHKQKSAA